MRTTGVALLAAFAPIMSIGAMGAMGNGPDAFRGARPIDTHWPEDQRVPIEWKEDWEKTLDANKARWEKEVERLVRDRRQREARLRLRLVRLIDALIRRFPNETERHVEGRRQMAEHLVRVGLRGRANYVLKQLVEDYPGRQDIATWALKQILDWTRWDRPYETDEGRQWVEYAARRLLALHRIGYLPASHSAVMRARQAMAVVRKSQGRLAEAATWLRALGDVANGDVWRPSQEAELLCAAGRFEEALSRLRDATRVREDSHIERRIAELSRSMFEGPPSFPGKLGLDVQWEILRGADPMAAAPRYAGLVEQVAQGSTVVPWGADRYTSIWSDMDRHLRAQDPVALLPLREVGKELSARAVEAARRSRTSAELLAAYRRYPWTTAAHAALLEYAEAALRSGQAELAQRSFQDLLSHATQAELRSRARVGLWLALASASCRAADINAAFNGIAADAVYPWLGEPTHARHIRERLLESAASDDSADVPPTLSSLGYRIVELPRASAWPWEMLEYDVPKEMGDALAPSLAPDIQVCGEDVLVSGPNLLCVFGGDPARPRWTRTSSLLKGTHGRVSRQGMNYATIPGVFRPTVAGDRVYTRWGLASPRCELTSVAAFDTRTGAMLWSTARDAAWKGMWPVSDPTVAEGRVYVLTVPKGHARVLLVVAMHLTCLDAESGTVLWSRKLGSQNFTLPSAHSSHRGPHIDLMHFGNALTVDRGAVYCSTNLGFVARCDARDGTIEWARTYPRARVNHNLHDLVKRRSAAPVVAGRQVVLAPRDCWGAFALDRDSGELLWDAPFVPSSQVIGLCGDALLVGARRRIAALDVASGQVRWLRPFSGEIVARPSVLASSVYVITDGRLLRISADDGRLIEEADPSPGPLQGYVIGKGGLIGFADGAQGPEGQVAPAPRPIPGTVKFPLKETWTLTRANPRAFVPPPSARLDGRVLILSDGTLECVDITTQGGVRWRRAVGPLFKSLEWVGTTMLLVYPQRVVAVNGASGNTRWEASAPFTIRRWRIMGQHLAIGEFDGSHRSRQTAVIDLSSGEVLWERSFRELSSSTYESGFREIGWDGEHFHLLGQLRRGDHGCFAIACRPSDGHIAGIREWGRDRRRWPEAVALGHGVVFYLDRRRAVHEVSLLDGTSRSYRTGLRDLNTRYLHRFALDGEWLILHEAQRDKHKLWILQRGDPGYQLRRNRPGVIRGDRFYELGSSALTAIDLPTKQECVKYVVPATRDYYNRVLQFIEQGAALLVVSGLDEGPHWQRRPARVRMDTFDRETGRHLGGELISGVPLWKATVYRDWRDRPLYGTQAARHGGLVLLTSFQGVHAFRATSPDDVSLERPRRIAYRRSMPIRVDGRLDDWRGASEFQLRGPDARLLISHDVVDIYLAATYPNSDARPRRGQGDYGAGDWLEVGLSAGADSFRLGIGLDDRGRVAWESMTPRGLPEGIRGRIGGDPRTGLMAYEIAIPRKSIVERNPGWLTRLGVSVTVWDETAAQGSPRAYTWGGALRGRNMVPLRHEPIHLHRVTREAEAAALALAFELPHLPESWEFFKRACRIRSGSASTIKKLHRDFLRRHPEGHVAERALAHLGQMLHRGLLDDPSEAVLAIAAGSGVSADVRQRYEQVSKAHFSQWIHIDPKTPPRALMLQLDHLPGSGGDGHRAFWGESHMFQEGALGTPSRRDGGSLPPAGQWQELRIPLVAIDMHDKPIHGIYFHHRGGCNLVWDRTAVVRPGKEHVIIDDKLPPGKKYGNWRWVSRPVRSGSRAHTEAGNMGDHNHSRRLLAYINPPVIEHIPPTDGPYLSQWVYISPGKLPRTLDIVLHDGFDWRWRAYWGQHYRDGQLLGPIPKPGVWHELRVPMTGTLFHCRPIRGLMFGQYGGEVFWDRTAVVADGKERVIVEDEMPTGRPYSSSWKWVDKPVRSGKTAHTLDRYSGSYRAHGVYGLEQPIVEHLPFVREEAVTVLRRHIPKLGASETTWRFFESLLHLTGTLPQDRIEQHKWLLTHFPDHPRGEDILKRLLDYHRAAKSPDPAAAVEAVIAECKPPIETRYQYRRRCLSTGLRFLRNWLLLGPFPNTEGQGLETSFPPESEAIDAHQEYEGAAGTIRWTAHEAKENRVKLKDVFAPNEDVVAYAVCWIRNPRRRSATLEVGSDDGCKVWLNRKLVLTHSQSRSLHPRQNIVPVRLRRGWNELMVKVVQKRGDWGFYFEVVDAEGRSLLSDVEVSVSPRARSS